MKEKKILRALGDVDDRFIEEADPITKEVRKAENTNNTGNWRKYVGIAACLLIVVIAAMLLPQISKGQYAQKGEITLSEGTTAKVTYGYNKKINKTSKADLVYFTEDELFSQNNMYAFRGKVKELTNVTIDFNGEQEVRCVATMEVEKVFQGDISEGQQIKMLLPCPIAEDKIWVEDTGIISRLKIGMEGIFMPLVYDEESYWEQNGAVLIKTDLASCGLGDGMRWAFLDTQEGLAFERNAYSGVARAKTLDEIEEYVMDKLN